MTKPTAELIASLRFKATILKEVSSYPGDDFSTIATEMTQAADRLAEQEAEIERLRAKLYRDRDLFQEIQHLLVNKKPLPLELISTVAASTNDYQIEAAKALQPTKEGE
jgi:hypothetical protein